MTKPNQQWANFIPDGPVNKSIALWHSQRPDRVQDCATPSTLTDCPRVVWLKYRKKVKPLLPLGWGKSQRMLLGRQFENQIALQLKESGELLHHWKDDTAGESVKFEMGEGNSRICGTPDLLLRLGDVVAISDAKTSTAKSFLYIPLDVKEAFADYYWFKYQLQVEAYYLLCHKNKEWFKEQGLLLPEVCHLFSYSLDDGIVRREFTWKPTQASVSKLLYYVNRWNRAFHSEEMPDCTCDKFDGAPRKFCYYATKQETTKTGAKIGTECCNVNEKGEVVEAL